MSTNKKKIKETIEKIKELRKVWCEAVELFDSIDDIKEEDWKYNSGFPTEYPFEQSFDEYPFEINEWIDALEDSIQKGE